MTRNAMLRDIFYKLWQEEDFKAEFKRLWPIEFEALHDGSPIATPIIELIWLWMQGWKGEK